MIQTEYYRWEATQVVFVSIHIEGYKSITYWLIQTKYYSWEATQVVFVRYILINTRASHIDWYRLSIIIADRHHKLFLKSIIDKTSEFDSELFLNDTYLEYKGYISNYRHLRIQKVIPGFLQTKKDIEVRHLLHKYTSLVRELSWWRKKTYFLIYGSLATATTTSWSKSWQELQVNFTTIQWTQTA